MSDLPPAWRGPTPPARRHRTNATPTHVKPGIRLTRAGWVVTITLGVTAWIGVVLFALALAEVLTVTDVVVALALVAAGVSVVVATWLTARR